MFEDHYEEDDDSDEDPTFEDPDEVERKSLGKRNRSFSDEQEEIHFSGKRARLNQKLINNSKKIRAAPTTLSSFQQSLQQNYPYRQGDPMEHARQNGDDALTKQLSEEQAAQLSAETEVKQQLFEHFQRVTMGSYPRDVSMNILKERISKSTELIKALARIQARATGKGIPVRVRSIRHVPAGNVANSGLGVSVTKAPSMRPEPLVKQRLNAQMANSLLQQSDDTGIRSAFRDSFESEVNKISEEELNQMSELDRNMFFTLRSCESIAIRLRHALRNNLQGILETNSLAQLKQKTESEAGAVKEGKPEEKNEERQKHIVTEQPEMLQLVLKEYQLVGLNWLNLLHVENINGILADEMGLGKTIQTISLFALLHEREAPSIPHLVICPSTTLANWLREINKWCPQFRVLAYYGKTDERERIRSQIVNEAFDIIVTTYKIAGQKKDRLFLKKVDFCYVVLDEAQGIKNKFSLRHQGLRKLNSQHRLLLTGTPLQNNLDELWALLQFIMPGVFDYDLNLEDEAEEDEEKNTKRVNRMKAIMAPFVLRRLKQHVSRDLPAKRESIESCEMTQRQKEMYYSCVQQSRSWWERMKNNPSMSEVIENPDSDSLSDEEETLDELPKRQRGWNIPKSRPVAQRPTTITGRTLSNVFMQLRKICNHPLLIRTYYSAETVELIVNHLMTLDENRKNKREQVLEEVSEKSDFQIHQICKEHEALARFMLSPQQLYGSGKVQAMETLLRNLHVQGHRVLIFSQMTRVLDILQEVLDLWNYQYLRLDGSTPVATRQHLIDRYNSDNGVFIFLLSTRAGGVGINLTSADTVIFYDIAFNPQVDRQAEDRCHRFGQVRPVTIYKLITARTVDQNMLEMAERKAELNDVMLEEGKKKRENTKVWQLRSLLSSVFEEIQ